MIKQWTKNLKKYFSKLSKSLKNIWNKTLSNSLTFLLFIVRAISYLIALIPFIVGFFIYLFVSAFNNGKEAAGHLFNEK